MIFFFRQFLAILLVLLQNIAPWVHAHIGDGDSSSGWHMHASEFTSFAANRAELAPCRHDPALTSAVVSIGSAIKQHLNPLIAESVSSCFPNDNSTLSADRHLTIIKSLPSLDRLFGLPFLRNNSSRDPPEAFFLF